MGRYTKEDIFRIAQEENVEFIRLQFIDMFGVLKNVAVTVSLLEKALNNRISFDGSAIEGFVGVEESDLYLYPDLDTFAIFPWRPQQGRVARFLCDIYYPDGRPFEGDSRRILKNVLQRGRDEGCAFLIGPECEFFLYHLDDSGRPTTLTHEEAGYFDVAPADLGENARRDMIMTMEEMGYQVDASHHEYAPGQHEIDLHYSEALYAADMITTFRLAARTVAKRHGLCATFMPKPKSGVHGSGMHINISVVKDGVNLFENAEDPNLASGYEAPQYIAWSSRNRSMLIRIPATRGFNTRIELRSPDSAANPYLALAMCLEAGMDGIRRRIDPPAAVEENMASMKEEERRERGIQRLPMTLAEAVSCLKEDALMKEVLGEHICGKLIAQKEEEWKTYQMQVSEWEIEQYLSRF